MTGGWHVVDTAWAPEGGRGWRAPALPQGHGHADPALAASSRMLLQASFLDTNTARSQAERPGVRGHRPLLAGLAECEGGRHWPGLSVWRSLVSLVCTGLAAPGWVRVAGPPLRPRPLRLWTQALGWAVDREGAPTSVLRLHLPLGGAVLCREPSTPGVGTAQDSGPLGLIGWGPGSLSKFQRSAPSGDMPLMLITCPRAPGGELGLWGPLPCPCPPNMSIWQSARCRGPHL